MERESQSEKWIAVCPSHGLITEEPCADEIVADLFRREHMEDCPAAGIKVLTASELAFKPASEIEVEMDEDGTVQAVFERGGE